MKKLCLIVLVSVAGIIISPSITWARLDPILQLREDFDISYEEASNEQLRDFLASKDNQRFVEAIHKQIKHGRELQRFLEGGSITGLPDVEMKAFKHLTKNYVFAALKLMTSRLPFLVGTIDVVSAVLAVQNGARVYRALANVLQKFDKRQVIKWYIEEEREKNISSGKAFEDVYRLFEDPIKKIILLSKRWWEPKEILPEDLEVFANYLELNYQSWKTACELEWTNPVCKRPLERRKAIKKYALDAIALILTTPSNLQAKTISFGSIELGWNDNTNNEDGFYLYRCKQRKFLWFFWWDCRKDMDFTRIASVAANQRSYNDSGLDPDTRYCYQVSAYNAAGESERSNKICVKTEKAPFITWELWGEDSASNLLKIDPKTGAGTLVGPIGFSGVTDIAFTSDGRLYGIAFNQLLQIDPNTGKGTPVGPPGLCIGIPHAEDVNALVSQPDGTLLAASIRGKLFRIDPNTGCATIIGHLGFGSSGDLAFAPDGRLFAAGYGYPDALYLVDPNTGASTLIGSIGYYEVYGLAFSPDGQLYSASSRGPKLIKIDLNTGAGEEIGTITNTNGSMWGLAVRIIGRGASKTILSTGRLDVRPFYTHEGIVFTVLGAQDLQLSIFNLAGRRVFNSDWVPNGYLWNLQDDQGRILANGVYLYIVTVRGFNGELLRSKVKKLVILK